MMKVYIATRYDNKADAFNFAQHLIRLGHEVTSSWVFKPNEDGETRLDIALRDLDDVDEGDTLIALSHNAHGLIKGGMWVEFGYALAKGKKVILIGPMRNVFCTVAHEIYEDVDSFLRAYDYGQS